MSSIGKAFDVADGLQILMSIDGTPAPSEATYAVINPATEEVFALAPECTLAQLDDAFAAASRAQVAWAADEHARRSALREVAKALTAAEDELAELLTLECGKPLGDGRMEVQTAVLWLQHYADLEVPDVEVVEEGAVYRVYQPLGVVAAITPWNFPIVLAAWKFAPALRAGNTVVLKPSPYTPMATLRMGEIMQQALPPGVMNVVSGGDEVGVAMTRHPLTAKVSFTGSVSGGRSVAQAVASDLKRLTLELGGNDPAIVLDDADPKAIATGLFWGAFYHNGQVCGVLKRVYVPESMADALADELAAVAESVTVGDGHVEGTQLGPISNRPQFERVQELLTDAIAHGGQVRTGGNRIGDRGFFFEPTIVTGLSAGVRLVDEEQFGPVLPIITYADLQEAIDQANDSKFGLGSSVWSSDPQRAIAVAKQLQAGTAWINMHAVNNGPDVPFGGAKWSGIGVENGIDGLRSFSQAQVVYGPMITALADKD